VVHRNHSYGRCMSGIAMLADKLAAASLGNVWVR
jgi:hypothetical protein